MKILIGMGIYLFIGIGAGRIFGYRGLLEIMIWPIAIPLALYLKRDKRKDGDVL